MKNLHLTLCAALGIVALTQPAFSHVEYGSWPSGTIYMEVNGTSFPIGNPYQVAIDNVEARFFNENPSNGYFINNYGGTSASSGNGINEVWFSSDPSYAPALTLPWLSGSDIVEADVVFWTPEGWTTSTLRNDHLAFGGPYRGFEPTAIHEFGHVAGLDHENREYNIMGTDWTHVNSNGTSYRAYIGEDAADGLVTLYGLWSANPEDVSMTPFKYKGAAGAYSDHELCKMKDSFGVELPGTPFGGQIRYDVSNGQTVQVEFTYENNGASYQDVQVGYYISTNSTISVFDRLIATAPFGLGRADVLTYSYTITLPTDLNNEQTYYLGAIVDYDDAVVETVEDNNEAYHIFQVTCSQTPYALNFNSGSNPSSLSASNLTIGNGYSLSVDLTTSGHALAIPFGFDTPVTVTLAGGQRLLCIDGGSGEILALGSKPGPVANYSALVPPLAALCGFTFSIQAIHFGGVLPFALSNAQDVRIGS